MVHKNDPNALNETKSISYRDAGVNIDAGNAFVDEIKEITKRTLRPEVLSNLGGLEPFVAYHQNTKTQL